MIGDQDTREAGLELVDKMNGENSMLGGRDARCLQYIL